MKSVPPDEFFRLVALNSGISDLRTVKDIYYGMIKTISREIKGKGVVNIPDWGKFYLTVYKERNFLDVSTGKMAKLPPRPSVKFTPDIKVKKYFQALI